MEGILSFIQKLQGYPERRRRQIAFATALAATGLLFLLWFFFLLPGGTEAPLGEVEYYAAGEEPPSPFAVFKESFGIGTKNIYENFSELGGLLQNFR